MRESEIVKKFSEQSNELYKAFKDYADNVLATERNVKGKSFSNISLDDKEKVINKLFNEEVARLSKVSVSDYGDDNNALHHYAENPMVKAFADNIIDAMVDMILPEVLNTSIGLIAELDFVDYGDVAKFELGNNGLYNVAKAGYRQKNTVFQQLSNQTVTLTPELRQVSIIATLFEIMAGRRLLAREVMKIVRSIESEMANEVWDAFATAVSAGSTPSALKVTNYAEGTAVKLAEIVTAYNGGSARAVFAGTPLALSHILPADSNYQYTLDDNYVRLGYIPTFHTFGVMPTPNFANWKAGDYSLKLPDNKLYVVSPGSDKIVKVAVGRASTLVSGIDENANRAETLTMNHGWACMACTNAVAGVISWT